MWKPLRSEYSRCLTAFALLCVTAHPQIDASLEAQVVGILQTARKASSPALRVRKQPPQMTERCRRGGGDALNRAQYLGAADRAYVKPQLRRLVQKLRVLVGRYEGGLERLRPVGRQVRRRQKR